MRRALPVRFSTVTNGENLVSLIVEPRLEMIIADLMDWDSLNRWINAVAFSRIKPVVLFKA